MKLIKSDYTIGFKDNIAIISMIVPYHLIAELQLMGTIIQLYMLPVNNIIEGISFILPSNYKGKASYFDNIRSGADIILQALIDAEKKYFSVLYSNVTIDRNDARYILPMCSAYKVLMECEKEMVGKIIDKIVTKERVDDEYLNVKVVFVVEQNIVSDEVVEY